MLAELMRILDREGVPADQRAWPHLYWATRDRLRELIGTVNDHMRREHS